MKNSNGLLSCLEDYREIIQFQINVRGKLVTELPES